MIILVKLRVSINLRSLLNLVTNLIDIKRHMKVLTILMNTTQTSVHQSLDPLSTVTTSTSPSSSPKAKSNPSPQPAKVTVEIPDSKTKPSPPPQPAKVTVEIPATSPFPVNPFDPTWIKLWEEVGPISYLGLMCLFVWLLTRLVQTVKGK